MKISDVVFRASDGTPLGGWIMEPDREGPHPAVVMSHGLSALIDLGLRGYAERFCAAGYVCLAYDHRNWGRSGGWPRCESDPWLQVNDMRDAVSFVRTLDRVDSDRVGLWGTSYSGGHAIVVGALDSRLRCVVSQVPFVSGRRNFDLWVPTDQRDSVLAVLAEDWDARARGATPLARPVAAPGDEVWAWARDVDTDGIYPNSLTFRSLDLARSYEPVNLIDRVAPTPLMMLVADRDTTTLPEWQVEAFDRGGDPKRLERFDCGHYALYTDYLVEAADKATEWFDEHLRG